MLKSAMLCVASASLLFAAAGVTASDDAVVADPEHYQVAFENDKVRVIHVKYGPGEKSVMHTHGPNVAIFLSDISVRMHLPDGSHVDVKQEHGFGGWNDKEEHLPENLSDQPLEVMLIELKDTN